MAKFSVTTSLRLISSFAISAPRGSARFRVTDFLETLRLLNPPERFGPSIPSAPPRKPLRRLSIRIADSRRITSAPKVASHAVPCGTERIQPISVMRIPESGLLFISASSASARRCAG